jgi:hypothetical protein
MVAGVSGARLSGRRAAKTGDSSRRSDRPVGMILDLAAGVLQLRASAVSKGARRMCHSLFCAIRHDRSFSWRT